MFNLFRNIISKKRVVQSVQKFEGRREKLSDAEFKQQAQIFVQRYGKLIEKLSHE